jgi:hypothetical protein
MSSGTESKYPIPDAVIRRNNKENKSHAVPKTKERNGEGELFLNLGIKWTMPKLKENRKRIVEKGGQRKKGASRSRKRHPPPIITKQKV